MTIGKGFWYALGGILAGILGFVICGLGWLATFWWVLGRVALLGLAVGLISVGVVGILLWQGIGHDRRSDGELGTRESGIDT